MYIIRSQYLFSFPASKDLGHLDVGKHPPGWTNIVTKLGNSKMCSR